MDLWSRRTTSRTVTWVEDAWTVIFHSKSGDVSVILCTGGCVAGSERSGESEGVQDGGVRSKVICTKFGLGIISSPLITGLGKITSVEVEVGDVMT